MSAFTDHLADPLRESIWLVELYPWDIAGEAVTTLRYSTDQYATGPADTPANTPYQARVIDPYNFQTEAFSPLPGGTVELPGLQGGVIRLGNRAGDLDTLATAYAWDGRRCVIRLGGYTPSTGHTMSYSEYGVVFDGEIDEAQVGLQEVMVRLRDAESRFDLPIRDEVYRGTGGCLHVQTGGGAHYVTMGTPSKLNITAALTVEFWVFLNSAVAQNLFGWLDGASAYPFQVSLANVDAGSCYPTLNASTYSAAVGNSAALLRTGRWAHVAITRTGTAVRFIVYSKNNSYLWEELITTGTASASSGASNSGGDLRISSSGGSPFLGFIDELRVWNYVRTDEDIRRNRFRSLNTAEAADSSLKGLWRANDGTGTTLTDASGTPANGTLTGGSFAWAPALEGGDDLQGTAKPVVYGIVKNMSPVLVDSATRTYQVHDGSVFSISAVYEGGSAIAAGTSYSSFVSFLATPTTAGTYDTLTMLGGSFIRLGSNPSLPITVDLSGEHFAPAGFGKTATGIALTIVASRGDRLTASDWDSASFNDLTTANSADLGLVVSDGMTVADALREVLGTVGAVFWFRRSTGKFAVQRIEDPSGLSSDLDLIPGPRSPISIEPQSTPPPAWKIRVEFGRNWTPLTQDQLSASIATTSAWTTLQMDRQWAEQSDLDIRTVHPRAREIEVPALFVNRADAEAEAQRLLDLWGTRRPGFELVLPATGYQLDRMDALTVDYRDLALAGTEQNRLGLDGTQKFLVLGIAEDAGASKLTVMG